MGKRRHFTPEFKREAGGLVVDQGYSIKEACEAMGVGETAMRRWVKQLEAPLCQDRCRLSLRVFV